MDHISHCTQILRKKDDQNYEARGDCTMIAPRSGIVRGKFIIDK